MPPSECGRATACHRLADGCGHREAPSGAAAAFIAPDYAPKPHRAWRCVAAAQSAGLVLSGRREVVLIGCAGYGGSMIETSNHEQHKLHLLATQPGVCRSGHSQSPTAVFGL